MNNNDSEDITYKVVVNHEEQYSIWDVDRPTPNGWRDAPKEGSKADCLAYIKEVWTDMRPLSLRKQMEKPASVVERSDVHLNGKGKKAISTD
jgi:MbtH protein